jgi:hypothetical protein
MNIRSIILSLVGVVGLALLGSFAVTGSASAADGEFNLQVSPSPLVLTLKPGETTSYDLRIRNVGAKPENLRIDPRSFTVDNNSGQVKFDDSKKPVEIGDWVHFSAQNFTVQPGEWYTQKLTFAIPKSAGFSYSFALVITRQNPTPINGAGQTLEGKVAIFALLNIDKPGATRKLGIQEFSTDQSVYEYLPAKLNVRFKNIGNTIVQPAGNIFVQRDGKDKTPVSTLSVNPSGGYILPGSIRTLTTQWNDGFQVIHEGTDASGKPTSNVEWNWANLSHIRIGKYTAKVIAIYNDGQRDVPLEAEVSFWVFPWKVLLGLLAIVVLLGFGIWSIVGKVFGVGKRSRRMSKSMSRRP